MGRVIVVVGGQLGSEAKGAVTGHLTKELVADAAATGHSAPMCTRVGGPNAGHTVIDAAGTEWKFRQLPVGAVLSPSSTLVIAQGSEVDPPVVEDEIQRCEAAGLSVRDRLLIDGQCTVIEDRHRETETGMHERIGSTGKGIGAARADRIMRTATIWQDIDPGLPVRTDDVMADHLRRGGDVIIEAAQGYGLGLHIGFYPHCTSADGRAIDALHDAGISPWAPYIRETKVWVVLRTYPIRVAGNSGPLYQETDWDTLSERTGGYIQPERTTVTNKIRRIGEWDAELAKRAIRANGENVSVALSFLDYIEPGLAGLEDWDEIEDRYPTAVKYVAEREAEIGAPIALVGTGPGTYVRTGREL